MESKGQTALEYLMVVIVSSVVVTILLLLMQSNISGTGSFGEKSVENKDYAMCNLYECAWDSSNTWWDPSPCPTGIDAPCGTGAECEDDGFCIPV